MTAANGERYCSQHHQPRSQCRPSDRHTQPLRAGDGLMAAVAKRGGDIGLSSVNDALEMALEAWLRLPVQEIAEQALADRRIKAGRAAASAPPAPRKPAPPGTVKFMEPAVKP